MKPLTHTLNELACPEIDEPVRLTRNGTNYYYHAAALGTVTELTGSTGTKMEQYSYDVYGAPMFQDGSGNALSGSAVGNRLLFQGRDRDPDTGLYNFRNRYYSPTLGRFLQTDPIGVRGGFNIYSSFENNPQVFMDPHGFGLKPPGHVFNGSPKPVTVITDEDPAKNLPNKCFVVPAGGVTPKGTDWDFVKLANGVWVKIGVGRLDIGPNGKVIPGQINWEYLEGKEEIERCERILKECQDAEIKKGGAK